MVGFIFCLLASLITPYGLTLWQYIPHLYFHPINRYIGELQPFTLSLAAHNFPLLCSFGCLSLLAVFGGINSFRRTFSPSQFIYLFIALIGIGLGLFFQRLITFGLLLMLPLVGSAFRIKVELVKDPRQKLLHRALILSAIAGSLSLVLFTHPTIPADSKAFAPPFAALDYIAGRKWQGNMLNDPEFGDVLMWNSKKPPKLFVDTRFDAYPWQILQDYMVMVDCKPTWQDQLTKYKIDWIFLSPKTPLCGYLEKDLTWQSVFKNEQAEIIVHRKTNQSINDCRF